MSIHLDYLETMYCWSPKLRTRLRLVGPQIALAEHAEASPDIVDFSFPGPTIALEGAANLQHQVAMCTQWRDGVTGAVDYLSIKQARDGLRERILESARRIGLRIEIIDRDALIEKEKHFSAWRQLIRFLHPRLQPGGWGLCKQLAGDEWPRERMTISDLARVTRCDAQMAMTASAHLIHSGVLRFDSDRGTFDLASSVWRASS